MEMEYFFSLLSKLNKNNISFHRNFLLYIFKTPSISFLNICCLLYTYIYCIMNPCVYVYMYIEIFIKYSIYLVGYYSVLPRHAYAFSHTPDELALILLSYVCLVHGSVVAGLNTCVVVVVVPIIAFQHADVQRVFGKQHIWREGIHKDNPRYSIKMTLRDMHWRTRCFIYTIIYIHTYRDNSQKCVTEMIIYLYYVHTFSFHIHHHTTMQRNQFQYFSFMMFWSF